MRCEQCGGETDSRSFYPGLAKVTHKIRHGQWLCRRCVREAVLEDWRGKLRKRTQEE
ncbi:MAG: hypothetical protein ACE5NN_06945 [Candidatus Bathyarchaeia archaeon]